MVRDNVDYSLIQIKGEGFFARVYKATQSTDGKLLAVKVWHTMADPEKEIKRRKQISYEGKVLKEIRGRVSIALVTDAGNQLLSQALLMLAASQRAFSSRCS